MRDKLNTPIWEKKGPKTGFNVGASSILVIFVMIALVTFSVMSIAAANADYKLSKSVAERNIAYYNATSAAHRQLRDAAHKENNMGGIVDFCVPVTEGQQLHVVAYIPAAGSMEDTNILRWQLEND